MKDVENNNELNVKNDQLNDEETFENLNINQELGQVSEPRKEPEPEKEKKAEDRDAQKENLENLQKKAEELKDIKADLEQSKAEKAVEGGPAKQKLEEAGINLEQTQRDLQGQINAAQNEIKAEQVQQNPPQQPVMASSDTAEDDAVKQMRQQMLQMQQQMKQMQAMMYQQLQAQENARKAEEQRKKEEALKREAEEKKAKEAKDKEAKPAVDDPEATMLNVARINKMLENKIAKAEEIARKAAKGKYSGKMMPNGMEPRYFYAAVRDYHKDMAEKISRIQDPKKKEEYFANYYNRKCMTSYVNFRAKDPVYRRMVDKYKAGDVMSEYQKARFARTEKGIKEAGPLGSGRYLKENAGFIHGFNMNGPLYDPEEMESLKFKEFAEELKRFNQTAQARRKMGEKGHGLPEMPLDELEKKGKAVLAEGKDNPEMAEQVAQANKVLTYINDLRKYGTVGANLRRDMRDALEDGKNMKVDYTYPAAAADYLIAREMLNDKNPKTREWWDNFPKGEEALKNMDAVQKNIDQYRTAFITGPVFNTVLLEQEGKKMEDFTKGYRASEGKEVDRLNKLNKENEKKRQIETARRQKAAESRRRKEEKMLAKENKGKKEVQKDPYANKKKDPNALLSR